MTTKDIPRAEAATEVAQAFEDYGHLVTLESEPLYIRRGEKRRPFDPQSDPEDARRMAYTLIIRSVNPALREATEQRCTELDRAFWMTVGSWKAHGLSMRTARNIYLRYKRVPTGETFVGTSGELVEKLA